VAHSIQIGTTVGEYRVTGFIGAGGMGEVYCAEHSKIGRRAAVKILTHTSGSDASLDRFFNEASIQSSLRHPNISTLYDFTEINCQPCIIMEYVDGQTLAERIRPSCPLELREIIFIFEAIVEAIAYIHSKGVVHRDIKSNNIKISSHGEVKLLDFGIAKSEASQQLTATGAVIGTLQYLSPEQLMGGVADARSDIWALGVLLYEMAVGRAPFEANTFGELCRKIQRVEYVAPGVLNPTIPREIATIINRCLRKNPTDRYRVTNDLLEDARRLRILIDDPVVINGVPDHKHYLNNTIRIALTSVDKRLLAILGLLMVVLVSVGAGVYLVSTTRNRSSNSSDPLQQASEQTVQSASTQLNATEAHNTSITIDVVGGKAKVYRDGAFVCETPCPVSAEIGETINVDLKREGYETLSRRFSVTAQTRTKTFVMQPLEATDH
jgi:eukaryotic-like serine/threonine-protein kinase